MTIKNFKGKHGPLLIAEIGGNHEGNFEYAKKLTKLAIESDVDYIKFQLYYGNTIVNPLESPERNKHFKITRAKDGDYIIIYNIEFPFCPGSFKERVTMNFSETHPFLLNQVLYKADYINAGSWACDTAESEKQE